MVVHEYRVRAEDAGGIQDAILAELQALQSLVDGLAVRTARESDLAPSDAEDDAS